MQSLFAGLTSIKKKDEEGNAIDPKFVICPLFKAGLCSKGRKCKNSHDLTVEQQKQTNIDIYADPRAKIGKMPDTIITCKHFIETVEKDLYGFNWICPNGGEACIYRHMLPQGYLLNRDKGEQSDDGDMTLEEKIDDDRGKLEFDKCTPVTKESFY